MRVYIAGPLTSIPYSFKDPNFLALNIRKTISIADYICLLGHVPFVPHLNHLWEMISPKSQNEWLKMDLEWLSCCHCLIRMVGDSKGADIEWLEAIKLHLPVLRLDNPKTMLPEIRVFLTELGRR